MCICLCNSYFYACFCVILFVKILLCAKSHLFFVVFLFFSFFLRKLKSRVFAIIFTFISILFLLINLKHVIFVCPKKISKKTHKYVVWSNCREHTHTQIQIQTEKHYNHTCTENKTAKQKKA